MATNMYRLPSFPVLDVTSLITKLKAGYFFGEATAIGQVIKTKLPVFFIHGDADAFVPYQMVHQLYDACPTEKELLVVPGAGHGLSFRSNPERYLQAVTGFIGSYIDLD